MPFPRFGARSFYLGSVLLVCGACRCAAAGAAASDGVSVPRFTHPGAGQTIYILMPDRFANGRTDNDRGGIPGGRDENGFDPTRIGFYHGGDFAGLIAHLDYIKGLNPTTIWTTPPFRNKPVQNGSAGYHGYWALDFLNVDPHLGTNADYAEFVRQAHARGLHVYLDIVVNHTADVIQYRGPSNRYIPDAESPYRDANGVAFDERAVAYNGLNEASAFPTLSPERSFPYAPYVPDGERNAKNPAWLNDVTLYHNRGNSLFRGESSVMGDFFGLDDTFTENPRVVRGFIDIFDTWVDRGVDGFRIDTMRHVNAAFWQAFNPAIRAHARAQGRPDFLQFGEVMNETGEVAYLSEFSTGTMAADATTDFPFAIAARKFVSQGAPAATLADFFARDDYYTDHDSNVHSSVTLLGNYDIGRFGYFCTVDNPGAPSTELAGLVKLGHGLLYLSRGMPVLHYGDEQGMIGRGGGDMQAREDMFAAQAPEFKNAKLLGTTRTGAEDKFDPTHPFYRLFARLGALRASDAALRTGAMIIRPTAEPAVFAFSRIDRRELVEYVAVFNNSRTATVTTMVPTSQPAGAKVALLFDSRMPDRVGGETVTTNANGAVRVTLPPLQFAVWRAAAALPKQSPGPGIALVVPGEGATLEFNAHDTDGILFPSRQEIRAEVQGGDGIAEVTFAMTRASRPGEYELLGVDDAAPYRIFWQPPADLAPGETITFIATVNDLRGHTATSRVGGIQIAPTKIAFGIPGSHTPRITGAPAANLPLKAGAALTLTVRADGTPPLDYQWLHNGELIRGATAATYTVGQPTGADAGEYRAVVHNLAGTTLSSVTNVTTVPVP